MPKILGVYVGESGRANFEIGVRTGTWGWTDQWPEPATAVLGDLFIISQGGGGRFKLPEWMQRTASTTVLGRITQGLYQSTEPLWPDEIAGERQYPYRVDFELLGMAEQLPFAEILEEVVGVIQTSATKQGRAFTADLTDADARELATLVQNTFSLAEQSHAQDSGGIALSPQPRMWWVNQGATYAAERDGSYLWAPQTNKAGHALAHHTAVMDLAPGDRVFHYANGAIVALGVVTETPVEAKRPQELPGELWNSDGYLARVAYFELEKPIDLNEIQDRRDDVGPFDRNGGVKQIYLSAIERAFGASLRDQFEDRWPAEAWTGTPEITKPLPVEGQEEDEEVIVPTREPSDPSKNYAWLAETTLWERSKLDELLYTLENRRSQIVLAGPPGTGKTWVAESIALYLTEGRSGSVHTVQFHPTYGYEDFVEGLRPVADGHGNVAFEIVEGTLIQLAEQARQVDHPVVLIIDEMNRANLPSVFGELLYLLEYRDKSISLLHRGEFALPSNLKIIATMNTADRSIRSIDSALRRRFDIFECPPDAAILSQFYERGNHGDIPGLLDGMAALNDQLGEYLDRHHAVGHTFFMAPIFNKAELERTWNRQIFPLIEEYFFDQPDVLEHFRLEVFWPNI